MCLKVRKDIYQIMISYCWRTELSFIKNNFVVEHFVTQIFCNSYKSSKNISILEKTNYIFYHGPMLFSLPKLLKLLHLWSFCVVFLGPQWILVP